MYIHVILPFQKRLEACSISAQDNKVSDQAGPHQDSPMRREGEEMVGSVGEEQGVDDVVTPISSLLSPPSACELKCRGLPFSPEHS